MTQVYDLLDNLRDRVRANNITNTVSYGDIMEVDLTKTTIYPLTHFILGDVTFSDHIITANINILALDVVDENKLKGDEDSFYGNNNLQDVMNTQLQVANDLQSHLRRGNLYNDLGIVGDVTANPMQDKFENELAGWGITFSVEMPNVEFSTCE